LHWACSGGHDVVVNYFVNEMGSTWDSPDDVIFYFILIYKAANVFIPFPI
jgi:hypothetical protein